MNNDDDDHTNDENDESFCNGMSMTMSMSGFQTALFGAKNKPAADCLTYLFHHWTLDSSGKFQGAMGEYYYTCTAQQ